MLYPSIDEIRTKVDSKYTLVVLAAGLSLIPGAGNAAALCFRNLSG